MQLTLNVSNEALQLLQEGSSAQFLFKLPVQLLDGSLQSLFVLRSNF